MKTQTKDVVSKDLLSEKEINLLKNRLNKGDEIELKDEYNITQEQTKKGFDYLWNQYQTPTGKLRKNNPFGTREQDALESFKRFTFDGYFNAGNGFVDWYMPIYTVYGGETSFQYTMKNGGVYIIG